MEVNYLQISYILIGVHSTMYLMHPNKHHVTTVCMHMQVHVQMYMYV